MASVLHEFSCTGGRADHRRQAAGQGLHRRLVKRILTRGGHEDVRGRVVVEHLGRMRPEEDPVVYVLRPGPRSDQGLIHEPGHRQHDVAGQE